MSDLREQLFQAAAQGDGATFSQLCRQYAQDIRQEFPDWRRTPEALRQDPEQIKLYGHGLFSVARFFAERLDDSSLLELLTPPDDNNPVVYWQRRLAGAQRRLEADEFAAAREALVALLEDTRGLQGPGADELRSYTLGSLAASHFHLGQLDEAEKATRAALDIVSPDPAAMARYLTELYELERYRGRGQKAREHALEIARLTGSEFWRRAAETVEHEPPLRVIASLNGREVELSELGSSSEDRIQFGYKRNRATLGESRRLNQLGKELAGSSRFEEAIELFRAAAAADPHDPDPRFMLGLTLTYLRRYAEALEHYAAVERLGPGWFHARQDAWLTGELAAGRLGHELWETLMALEHMPPTEALQAADRALAEAPLLAPLLLRKALCLEALGRPHEAVIPLRVALEHASEPNLRTRLLLRLSQLVEPPERAQLLRLAHELNGDLIAGAMAGYLLIKS